jgi:hypothetical protein
MTLAIVEGNSPNTWGGLLQLFAARVEQAP